MPQGSSDNLNTIACKCSDCKTAFCQAKRNHETKCSCIDCKNYLNETSVFYFGKSHEGTTGTEVMSQGTDAGGSSALQRAPDPSNEYAEVDENSTEILNKTFSKESSKSEPEVNENLDDIATAHKVAVKNVSTTAHLSAQIMNLSYRDFKDTLSREKPEKVYYNTNDILKRIKEAYDACTCKICECIIGKSALSRTEPCNCEPCNCKDCTSFRRGDLRNVEIDPRVQYIRNTNKELEQKESVIESKKCGCKPCDCIQCTKITISKPCDCEPCQCIDCKSVASRNKTVIVAPVGEGNQQRANCLCAPCDCARCTHRGLNLSPNRVHEMSTGINRHPNCRCESCVDEACEPNGTDNCRCQGRQGIIRKPVDRNPNDFDIHRTIVSNNPVNFHEGRTTRETISMFSSINNTKYPQRNNSEPIEKECKCSICECIVCKCKGNELSNSKTSQSQNTDKTLKTWKLPSTDSKVCKCLPCDCEYCSDKTQGRFAELEFKGCTCEICDCIHCEGVAKPRNAFSKLIPVSETWTREKCECQPCECNDCRKKERDSAVCHCDICRCERCAHKDNASEEALYPIKKGELLTPSLLRRDPLSEPEILSQSSEYTELKHSKGQSNVFKRESRVPERSERNFTIYHMVPERNTNQSSFEPKKSVQPAMKLKKLDSLTESNKVRRAHVLDKAEENDDITQFYCASTSKNSSSGVRVETQDSYCSCSNELKSIATACLHDPMYKSLTPSLLSILSTHHFLNLSPCLSNNNKKSCQVSISSPDRKVKHLDQLDKTRRIGSLGTCNNEKQCGRQVYSSCVKNYITNNFNRLINDKVTQTLQDETNQDDDSLLNHPLVKYLLSNRSNFNMNQDSVVSKDSHQKPLDYDYEIETIDLYRNNVNALRLENFNPRSISTNTIDFRLPNKCVPYKSALITLQKAKQFSLELMKLLEQYEKANLEFESMTKKLKKSHESILNAFKHEVFVRTYEDTGSETECYRIEQLNNNVAQTMDCNTKKSSRSFSDGRNLDVITENPKKPVSDNKNLRECNHSDRLGLNYKSIAVKSANEKHNDAFKDKSSKQSVKNDYKNIVTEDNHSSTTDFLRLVDGKVKIDKETENMKPPENYYKVYRKLIKRSAYIARKFNQKSGSPSESKIANQCLPVGGRNTKVIETEIVKEMIRQEMHVIMKEFKSLSAADTKAVNASVVEDSPIQIKEIESFAEESRSNLYSKLSETNPKVKAQGSITPVHDCEVEAAEKFTSTDNLSVIDERASYASNKALENLQNEVKELLNMPALQSHSTQNVSSSLIKPVKEIQVKDASSSNSWLSRPLPVSPAVYNFNKGSNADKTQKMELEESQRQKKDFIISSSLKLHSSLRNAWSNSKVSHKSQESKSSCDSMKVSFLGARRVSDHTVMVKWNKPKGVQDIHGYEILVDGRAVQKIFSPARCMAVVTCLPHVERILLTIRTITKVLNKSGSYPCSTIVYRPRAK